MGAVVAKIPNRLHPSLEGFDQLDMKEAQAHLRIASTLATGSRCDIGSWMMAVGEKHAEVFRRIDGDGDGMVEKAELSAAIFLACRGKTKEKAKMLFNLFDGDDRGVLTEAKLELMIKVSFSILSCLAGVAVKLPEHFPLQVARMTVRAISDTKDGISQNRFVALSEQNISVIKILGKFGSTVSVIFKPPFRASPNRKKTREDGGKTGRGGMGFAFPNIANIANARELRRAWAERKSSLPNDIGNAHLTRDRRRMDYTYTEGKVSDLTDSTFGSAKLSLPEVTSIKEVFDVLDSDLSGEIDITELEESFNQNRKLQCSTSPIFQKIDKNGNGKVSFGELLECMFPSETPQDLRRMTKLIEHVKLNLKDMDTIHESFIGISEASKFEIKVEFAQQRMLITVDEEETVKDIKYRIELLMDFIPDTPAILKIGERILSENKKLKDIKDIDTRIPTTVTYAIPKEQKAAVRENRKVELLTAHSSVLGAARSGDVEKLKLLLKNERVRKRRVKAADRHGKTLLHHGAVQGSLAVVSLIVNLKADINAASLKGNTPLHFACKRNNEKVIDYLMKHGANTMACNKIACTPFELLTTAKLKRKYSKYLDLRENKILPGLHKSRLRPLCVNKTMVQYRLPVKDILKCMEENPKVSKYTNNLSVVRVKTDHTRLTFLEFISQVFKDMHHYSEMESLLHSYVDRRVLSKAKLLQLYPMFLDAEGTENYCDIRSYLKTHQYKADDANSVIEWYESVKYGVADETGFRHEFIDFWRSLPKKLLKHAGYRRKSRPCAR